MKMTTVPPPPTGPWGTCGALELRWIKKLHQTESDQCPILAGVPFIKKCQNSQILVGPQASPAFWPRFLGPWAEFQNSAPNILHDPPAPKPREEIDLAETGLTPRAAGSKSPTQKLLARRLVGPENFAPIRPTVQKLQHFFEGTDTHTHTDTQTKTNHPCIIGNFFLHMCEGEGNSTNPTKEPLHFVKEHLAHLQWQGP